MEGLIAAATFDDDDTVMSVNNAVRQQNTTISPLISSHPLCNLHRFPINRAVQTRGEMVFVRWFTAGGLEGSVLHSLLVGGN